MKLSVTIAAALIAGIASASPLHSNKKRILEIVDVYEESIVTVTEGILPTPTPAAAPAPARADAVAASAPEPTPLLPPAAPAAAKPAVVNPEAAEAAESGDEPRLAIVLTPFAGSPDAVECKSQETINNEFDFLAEKGFLRFRYHGTDCDQAYKANIAAQRTGTELFLGAFNLRNVVAETQELIRQVQASGGWSRVHMVALGNEDLSKNMAAAEVVQQVQTGMAILRAAGYQGHVVHPETVDGILNNKKIMCSPEAGSRLAINLFPFFDPNVVAEEAGNAAARQTRLISECSQMFSDRTPGKDVVVSEAGWPGLAASNNGNAVASPEAQMQAIASMVATVSAEQYLFTAFDHAWQRDFAGSFGAEKHYGLFGKGYKWDWHNLRRARSRLIHNRN